MKNAIVNLFQNICQKVLNILSTFGLTKQLTFEVIMMKTIGDCNILFIKTISCWLLIIISSFDASINTVSAGAFSSNSDFKDAEISSEMPHETDFHHISETGHYTLPQSVHIALGSKIFFHFIITGKRQNVNFKLHNYMIFENLFSKFPWNN